MTPTPPGTKPPPNRNVWIVSDTHFGHENINRLFKLEDGSKARPFNSAQEGDEYMVAKWNAVVQPNDKVYHLGDVAMNRRSLAIMERLNGTKILVRGNHDTLELKDYAKYFKDVRSFLVLNGCVFTHAPLHPMSLARFGCNVHGHTHHNTMKRVSAIGGWEDDPNYLNVCVEKTDYAPISLNEVFKRVESRGGTATMLETPRKMNPWVVEEPYIDEETEETVRVVAEVHANVLAKLAAIEKGERK